MSESTLIKYGAQSPVARWFNSYWSERDKRAALWLVVSILFGFLLLGPRLLLKLVSMLPLDQLGNSGASVRAHQTLVLVASLLVVFCAVIVFRKLLKPSFIELSTDGIRKVWLMGFVPLKGRVLPWSAITTIHTFRPHGKTALSSYQLRFGIESNASKISLVIGDLEGDEARGALLGAISRSAVNANIEPGVLDVLTPKTTLSFTEIWLDALSAPPKREQLLPLSPGALLDNRYRILRRLGAGGQGTVYLAQDAQNNCDVVLKETILPVYADLISRKRALEEFHKEAFALESVKHPNIVKFIGSFVADHRAYLVLAYIDGETLSETIEKDGVMLPARTKELAIQMCDILSALHSRIPPLVHRDFTPDNLMLDSEGRLMLIDFAVAVSGDRAATDVAGKASYMAPEQFKGKPTNQSDLYSLGCTMFYMLTGQHPDPLSECHPIVSNREVPKELSDVVAESTKYNLADRLQNVVELKSRLERCPLATSY